MSPSRARVQRCRAEESAEDRPFGTGVEGLTGTELHLLARLQRSLPALQLPFALQHEYDFEQAAAPTPSKICTRRLS